jgi:hypothetical protein
MDEMRGDAPTLQRVLLIVTHNRMPGNIARYWAPFWLENRFPHFGENALTMGRKKFIADVLRRPLDGADRRRRARNPQAVRAIEI